MRCHIVTFENFKIVFQSLVAENNIIQINKYTNKLLKSFFELYQSKEVEYLNIKEKIEETLLIKEVVVTLSKILLLFQEQIFQKEKNDV